MEIIHEIGSDLEANWKRNLDDWGEWKQCDEGQIVTGFRTRNEKPQGSMDDTALNAIEVMCSDNTR